MKKQCFASWFYLPRVLDENVLIETLFDFRFHPRVLAEDILIEMLFDFRFLRRVLLTFPSVLGLIKPACPKKFSIGVLSLRTV